MTGNGAVSRVLQISRSIGRRNIAIAEEGGLFRKQATDARRAPLDGAVQIGALRWAWLATALSAAIVATAVGFLWWGQVSDQARVSGRVVSADGDLTLRAPVAGEIEFLVRDNGQEVAQGEVLIRIRTEHHIDAAYAVGHVVATQIEQQRARLERDLADLAREGKERDAHLRGRGERLQARLALQLEQETLRDQQRQRAEAWLAQAESLRQRQLVGALQWQQYEAAAVEAIGQWRSAQQQRFALEQDIAETNEQRVRLPQDLEAKRRAIEADLAETRRLAAVNMGSRERLMRAPRAGRIAWLPLRSGQTVNAGDLLGTLMPNRSQLQAELWVPSRVIGHLRPQQSIWLSYSSYPRQVYGLHPARLLSWSSTAMSPEEVWAATGIRITEPAFRAVAALERETVAYRQHRLPLLAGMRLESELLLEKRRLLRHLLPARRERSESAASGVSAATAVRP